MEAKVKNIVLIPLTDEYLLARMATLDGTILLTGRLKKMSLKSEPELGSALKLMPAIRPQYII
jgi:hypothetical protein